VLTPQECAASIEEIWLNLQEHSFSEIKRDNPDTWENVDRFVKNMGLIGGGSPVMLPQALLNRMNPRVYEAYRQATGQEYFLAAHERYGFMRPSYNKPELKTIENWLHIDMNPITGRTSTFGYYPTKANG
jgi:hypothetical protein